MMGDEREGLDRPTGLLRQASSGGPLILADYARRLEARVGQLTQELADERQQIALLEQSENEVLDLLAGAKRRITELEAALKRISQPIENMHEWRITGVSPELPHKIARSALSTSKEEEA